MKIELGNMTPGPWAKLPQIDDPYEALRIANEAGRVVCEVCLDDAPVEDYNREQHANAAGVAATPQALYALRLIFEAVQHSDDPQVFARLIGAAMGSHGIPALLKARLIDL